MNSKIFLYSIFILISFLFLLNYINIKQYKQKKIVEILYRDGDTIIPLMIEHDTEHPDWQQLMNITNLDDIHLNTHNFIKQSQKDFKKMVMKIPKEDGLVKEVVAELSTKFYDEVFEFFFNYNDK